MYERSWDKDGIVYSKAVSWYFAALRNVKHIFMDCT